MAGHSKALDEQWARERFEERCEAALKKDYGAYAPVGEKWTKQTRAACIFPTRGVIAHTLLRWQKPDGSVVAFPRGYEGDTLIAPLWALRRTGPVPVPAGHVCSGDRHALYDARGIFCAYVCDVCEDDRRSRYRADIFTDRNYWHDEPIEEHE